MSGRNPNILKSGRQDQAFYKEMWETISDGQTWYGHLINRRKDGTLYTEKTSISPVSDASGQIVNYVAIKRDITEELNYLEEKAAMEKQLLSAQKLEAIGKLAGGVAHDFNNMLNIIIGYGEMILGQLNPDDPLRGKIGEIVKAGQHSAALTHQLLAFSRRQTLQPEVLDLNVLLSNLEKMLRRLLREDIELLVLLSDDSLRVLADRSQLEQVIIDLAVNARDAMPLGGKLVIETAVVGLDSRQTRQYFDLEPGRYVRLTVTDSGVGMDKETLSHIFEPFFTTKEMGKGTGLGLSTAYGIMKQSGGFIEAYSQPGQGAIFTIYLPQTFAEATTKEQPSDSESSEGGCERILVVEDQAGVRNMVETMLSSLGYEVCTAVDGNDALQQVDESGLPYDLIVTDAIMPGMSGSELVERLLGKQPDIKVLFMSGYTEEPTDVAYALKIGSLFLQKPFTLRSLSEKVRELLDDKSVNNLISGPCGCALPAAPAPVKTEPILVVEDQAINREMLSIMLSDLGWPAHIVESGPSALEALAKASYSLVLMDIEMPEMNGFEASSLIRKTEIRHRSDLPIIAMTGHDAESIRAQCLLAGMDDCISKPFNSAQLASIVEKWLPIKFESDTLAQSRQAAAGKEIAAPIDLSAVRQKYGEKNVERLLAMVLADLPKQMLKLKQAAAEANLDEIRKSAHGLKGICDTVIAKRMRQSCLDIENAARDGNGQLMSSLIQNLETELAELLDYLKNN